MNADLPDDSWFTKEELAIQKARNIHARIFVECGVDDPHNDLGWWRLSGHRLYRAWVNETHQCDDCDDICFITKTFDQLSTTKEGEL